MRKRWLRALWGVVLITPALSFNHPNPAASAPDPEAALALYPKDYFHPPVADPLRLSGTFGELRSGHFHSGIDIKSKTGGVGQPIHAAAEGYIDRIKVQEGGYGKVVYINHPNGYTTVYAHLDKFMPAVEQYVREAQYRQEVFEVSLEPPRSLFKIKKGDVIGRMGNTGSSSGPHLHFEIRHTSTDRGLNPELFGLPVPDRVPPELRDMKVYFLSEQREVIAGRHFPILRRSDGSYAARTDTMRIPAWRVGFGVKAYDQMSGLRNDNGIYALTLHADGVLAYQWSMDELDFDESRYINAHVDYPARARYGAWFHRCFVLPGDGLSNYTRTPSLGAITLYRDKPVKCTLTAWDASGNKSALTYWLLRDDITEMPAPPPFQYELPYDAPSRLELPDFSLFLPQGTLYEKLYFQYKTTPDNSHGVYSDVHHLHDEAVPAHRYFEIGIRPRNLPEDLRSKAYIAKCGSGRPQNSGGQWRGDMLVTRVREFGDYCVMTDTEPPSIVPVVFDRDMRRKASMSFRLRDNVSIGGSADGLYYRGTIDGHWVLFEYDRKNARLTHTFDGRIAAGQHLLRLLVTDDRGNNAVFEKFFVR
jgi:murein DD-endopeptidase MepM/ murein hydrolase activator NlpD